MDPLNLEPRYSTSYVTGRCVRCLAEEELACCLRQLLNESTTDEELQAKYQMILNFLQSPEVDKLINESEKLLSEGKKVTLKISLAGEKPAYELEINNMEEQ